MTKAAYSGTAVKPETIGSYQTGNIGSCKTWHGSPRDITKGIGTKVGNCTIAYAPGADRNKKYEI